MKENFKRLTAILLALVMVLAMSTSAFAATGEKAALPSVKVSITANSFNTSGEYVEGKGFTNLNIPIEKYEIPISSIEYYINDTQYWNLKSVYLPTYVSDPMNGKASVADAIIAAIWEHHGKYTDVAETNPTVTGGWDSYNTPNGGYISNIMNYQLKYNPTTYFKGSNGNKWGRSTGTGWNVAYKYANGAMKEAKAYATNIALEDGMEIIFDVSNYDMTWDTGEAWTGR